MERRFEEDAVYTGFVRMLCMLVFPCSHCANALDLSTDGKIFTLFLRSNRIAVSSLRRLLQEFIPALCIERNPKSHLYHFSRVRV